MNTYWTSVRSFLSSHFRRSTSSVAYIPQVDGLRTVALLLVIAHHVFAFYLEATHRLGTQKLPRDWAVIGPRSPLVAWALHLGVGVPIFFMISGFVLAIPFASGYISGRGAPSLRLYLMRRLIRIEPPYALSMTFFFVLVMDPFRRKLKYVLAMAHLFGGHYLATLAYVHAFVYGGPSWLNGAAWTLEIEIQFYVLLPLLALLFRIRNKPVRRAAWVGLTLLTGLLAQFVWPQLHSDRLGLSIIAYLQYFFAGMLLADFYADPPSNAHFGARTCDVCAVVAVAAVVYVRHWRPALMPLEPLLLGAFFLAAIHGRWTGRLLSSTALTAPGIMCYTLYLYHIYIIRQLLPFTIRLFPPRHALWLDCAVQFAMLLPCILAISVVPFLAIERPAVLLSHRWTRRLRTPRARVQEAC